MLPIESGLAVLVPEAEFLVGPFRAKYDPSAAAGMPAHITLLYPFKPPHEIGEAVIQELARCFAGFGVFEFSLAATRRFPGGVLYLVPKPDEPFRRLTSAIWALYPLTPPYGGGYSRIVPHLTVASSPMSGSSRLLPLNLCGLRRANYRSARLRPKSL